MIMLSNQDFIQQLKDQLYFLERAISNFGNNEAEAKQAATVVATLVFDNMNPRSRTRSLLWSRMNISKKDIKFLETRAPKGTMFGFHINPGKSESKLQLLTKEEITNLISPYVGLVAKELSEVDGKIILKYVPLYQYKNKLSNAVHAPMIYNFPWGFGKAEEEVKRDFIDFDLWWDGKIYDDCNGYSLTRKQLIINVRDTDGGSHVDDELDENYAQFKKKDSLTMNIDGHFQDFNNIPAYSSVMQIAWETLTSIKRVIDKQS